MHESQLKGITARNDFISNRLRQFIGRTRVFRLRVCVLRFEQANRTQYTSARAHIKPMVKPLAESVHFVCSYRAVLYSRIFISTGEFQSRTSERKNRILFGRQCEYWEQINFSHVMSFVDFAGILLPTSASNRGRLMNFDPEINFKWRLAYFLHSPLTISNNRTPHSDVTLETHYGKTWQASRIHLLTVNYIVLKLFETTIMLTSLSHVP